MNKKHKKNRVKILRKFFLKIRILIYSLIGNLNVVLYSYILIQMIFGRIEMHIIQHNRLSVFQYMYFD